MCAGGNGGAGGVLIYWALPIGSTANQEHKMSRKFISAASIAALMAVGLAACGQQTRTASDETTEQQERSEHAEAPYEQAQPEALAQAPRPSDDASLAQPEVPNTGGATTPAAEAVAIVDVRVRTDAEQAAVAAFQMADANGDGVLDQEEYLTIAMAAESGLAEAAPALEQGEVDIGAPEQQIRAAEADASAVEAAFAEIAGETGEATKDDLRAAFLARFEQADADGDGQLDEEERLTFAALMIGVSDEPQP